MARRLDPFFFVKITEAIEKTAREDCNDPEGKRIGFKANREYLLEVNLADQAAAACLLQAMHVHLGGMTLSTQAVFGDIITRLRYKTRQSKANSSIDYGM